MKPSMSIRIDRKKYLYELVTKIENLGYISEDGIEIKVTTVEQFFGGAQLSLMDSLMKSMRSSTIL